MHLLNTCKRWFKSRHFGRSAIDTRYALVEACLIGVLSAVAALLLKEGIGWLGGIRLDAANQFGAWITLPLAGLIFGGLSGWVLEHYSPAAAGGGIPQVKAALARFPISLSLKVAIVKLFGTILVLGAGLTLGRRAPTVHIGAALAAQLCTWVPTSPEHRRQMIAAGAAAGLAAGFATPIAGVLFVVEELMRDVSGLTLETAIVASFTGAVVSMLLQSADLNIPAVLLDTVKTSFSAPEIPFYILLGALAGVLGAFFNKGVLYFSGLQRRLNLSLSVRIGVIGCFSGFIIALLPPFFRDNAGLREFLVNGELSSPNIAIAFVAHFLLTMLAYSSGAPGGLFAPALVMGSALGYLVGEVEHFITGTSTEVTFALAGMGAMFTGVVRVPITAIVIVFELNSDFNLVLPLMITCAVSYITAESVFGGSLYQHLLIASGIPFKEENANDNFLSHLTAADVMQSQVETLSSDLTLDEVLKIMSLSHHRGFPVVAQDVLVGIFTQSDLDKKQHSKETLLKEIMTNQLITVNPSTSISDVLFLLNRYKLSRLPVTEGNKLVGIITRTDIIRVEVNQLSGQPLDLVKTAPSYIIYQTRSPATGKGRILLPIANPETATALFQIAGAIARYHNYEIDCLQIIKISRHSSPSETQVDTREARKIMHRLERMGRQQQLSVHTQIRVAQDISEAIIETIRERHIKMMVMGWKGNTSTQGAIFGDMVDTLIHQATCELVLVKLSTNPLVFPYYLNNRATWLVSLAGGPNAQSGIQLLPAFAKLYARPDTPELWLCRVYLPSDLDPDYQSLQEVTQALENKIDKPIISVPICSHSVVDAITDLAQAKNCDVVMLGASREGLLKNVIYGNIPETIAKNVDGTVILVRGAL
ncbi:chloride channel protein [Aphanothece hegewaldii CCALA 016]|uniref:Chloride channel protein n=1 Tax=Aphanothece hegewaldii CCALA 016 TaxID=2107694 RepID=A0A2T1LTL6_9CHRO|nr:chloride channel protein [Aphanothece hegewaldii]PSF34462.1 chloride channel protein [Aphanothece hegewaldii CCALA 016]